MTTKTDDKEGNNTDTAPSQEPSQETPPPSDTESEREEQDAESALEAGFNETRGNTPVEEPAPKQEATADGEGKPKQDDAPKEAAPGEGAPEGKRLSDEQFQEILNRVPGLETRFNEEIQKVYGKFGELNRAIQNLQRGNSPRAIKGALKKLRDEFPDVAEVLEEDLSGIFPAAPADAGTAGTEGQGTETPRPDDIDARVKTAVDEAVARVREETGKRLLTFMHPKWETDVKTKPFLEFMQQLPEADRVKYGDSDDPVVAAECFTKFYDWKKAKESKPSSKPNPRHQERLESAITPSGEGAPPPNALDDEAAFVAGFKEIRQGG